MAFWSTKKSLITEHRKSVFIFRDINCFFKMSVSTSVRYQIFVYALAHKLGLNIITKFDM